ncbi:trichome birefringence-like protein 35 [Tanacetum coccineum]
MNSESNITNFSHAAPLPFDGENYRLWAIKMETYLQALDLWEAVEEDYKITPLPENATVAQIKSHKDKKTKKSKAKAALDAGVSTTIFTKIMNLTSAKDIWDYLKEVYEGDERIQGMKALNLIREFELQRMKESKTIKEYSERLIGLANKIGHEAVVCKKSEEAHIADEDEEEEDKMFVA